MGVLGFAEALSGVGLVALGVDLAERGDDLGDDLADDLADTLVPAIVVVLKMIQLYGESLDKVSRL